MARRSLPQTDRDFPSWVRTLDAMKAEGIVPIAWCSVCRVQRPVDLEKLIAIKGDAFSLINRRPLCSLTDGCLGRVRFLYPGHGCLRTLETEPCTNWRIERDWRARQAVAAAIRDVEVEREDKRKRDRR